MPRRTKNKAEDTGPPAWLITFSDLMTLLLTFFVLLLSMAVIDERAKRTVLGSVSQALGLGTQVTNPLASSSIQKRHEPGPIDTPAEDLSPLRDMIFDDIEKDLDFQANKYVQILSISDEVLFLPGESDLRHDGILLLDRIVPYLEQMRHPLLIAGHTAAQRDEEFAGYIGPTDSDLNSTWSLSFERALAVYLHLVVRGINPGNLSLEAFGQYHPRASNNSPEGRQKNRRVDLVLDKRNREWAEKIEELRSKTPESDEHLYKGFRFNLTTPDSRDRRP